MTMIFVNTSDHMSVMTDLMVDFDRVIGGRFGSAGVFNVGVHALVDSIHSALLALYVVRLRLCFGVNVCRGRGVPCRHFLVARRLLGGCMLPLPTTEPMLHQMQALVEEICQEDAAEEAKRGIEVSKPYRKKTGNKVARKVSNTGKRSVQDSLPFAFKAQWEKRRTSCRDKR